MAVHGRIGELPIIARLHRHPGGTICLAMLTNNRTLLFVSAPEISPGSTAATGCQLVNHATAWIHWSARSPRADKEIPKRNGRIEAELGA